MQFHAKCPLFDSKADREFTFSYAILKHSARKAYLSISYRATMHSKYPYVLHGLVSNAWIVHIHFGRKFQLSLAAKFQNL